MAEKVMAGKLIDDMTIHITTYDTCVYVDKSVDFVDYSGGFHIKNDRRIKLVYNSNEYDVDKITEMILIQSMTL